MATEAAGLVTPRSAEELAAEMRAAADSGRALRVRGAGTKLGWAAVAGARPEVELSTAGLDRILEHNAGDLTAVIEAGVPLAAAQKRFAGEGQMLALDPPDEGATVGGVVAAGDSGPLRSRYGGVRDLVVGVSVALSDGTVAKAGSKVIKNVAGYDLAKLFAGSLGSLGAILQVSVRLHPIPPATTTAAGATADRDVLARAALGADARPARAHGPRRPLGEGRRLGGGPLRRRGVRAAGGGRREGHARGRTRGGAGGGRRPGVGRAARGAAGAAGRAGHGGARVGAPDRPPCPARGGRAPFGRAGYPGAARALVAAPPGPERRAPRRWRRCGAASPPCCWTLRPRCASGWTPGASATRPRLELMRRVKERFDPAGVCAPGVLL